jgi:hypothetical protein
MMDYCLSCLPSTINEKKGTVTETGTRRTKQGENSNRRESRKQKERNLKQISRGNSMKKRNEMESE